MTTSKFSVGFRNSLIKFISWKVASATAKANSIRPRLSVMLDVSWLSNTEVMLITSSPIANSYEYNLYYKIVTLSSYSYLLTKNGFNAFAYINFTKIFQWFIFKRERCYVSYLKTIGLADFMKIIVYIYWSHYLMSSVVQMSRETSGQVA